MFYPAGYNNPKGSFGLEKLDKYSLRSRRFLSKNAEGKKETASKRERQRARLGSRKKLWGEGVAHVRSQLPLFVRRAWKGACEIYMTNGMRLVFDKNDSL